MRITSGQYRGVRLTTPKGDATRPTSDKVRESLFNILRHLDGWHGLDNAVVLDAFCGTGALGIEAMSNGAVYVVFWDVASGALHVTKDNLKKCKINLHDDVKVMKKDATKATAFGDDKFDLIFLDPPYRKGMGALALSNLYQMEAIHDQSLIVMEAAKNYLESIDTDIFDVFDERRYGDTVIQLIRIKK